MTEDRRTVEVWMDADVFGTARVGFLHTLATRGKQVFSFEYDDAWLASGPPMLDPRLQNLTGLQYVPDDRVNFGVFLDSCPDRWGRVLMQRREAQLARAAKRTERRLMELDYLLGVYDGHRMGGLRYRIGAGPFLDDNAELASPPWTSLRELEQASLHLERAGVERDPRFATWLKLLLAPGRSLGGARPKASVLDERGDLWLAKFPSATDEDDIGAWEGVVHTLATSAGIITAAARTTKLKSRHHTFLTRRFDRTPKRQRIHFASALTLLDRADGQEGASYLDIVELVARQGAEPGRDLEQLWRRIVFFLCVSNLDDHVRNHGFLLSSKGWSLAPAYDMNPNASGDGLTLNISETDNTQDLGLVRDVAKHFRLKPARADEIIAEVRTVVATWRAVARKAKLSRAEQDRMANAFRLASDD
jgi:serine/threonine-protein kinase HipA